MDFVQLKKKLSTFVSAKGYFTNISDDVLYEVLIAWEDWGGSSKEFYRGIGYSQTQMVGIIGKGKKLKREGHFGAGDFKSKPANRPVRTGFYFYLSISPGLYL